MFQPVIKWSGSKRSQSQDIINHFPNEIDCYYECFCGGCSVLRALLESDIKVGRYVCSDLNHDLIKLWKMVKSQPDILLDGYERLWNELNKDKDITRQKTYYENVRERFNGEHNPIDFLFLNRTCFNGLIRYNRKGEFNSPFHLNRPGIEPLKLKKILFEWSDLLNRNNVEFYWDSYHNINDFIYLDPPYANTKGMYNGEFDKDKFFQYVRDLKCGYALSYDGKSGDEDNTFNVPKDLYDEHMYLKSGKSSFKRIKEVVNDAMVYESLYVKKK